MWYKKTEKKLKDSSLLPEVNPILKYILFFFSVLFWLVGLGLILIGLYACVEKDLVISDFSNLITDPAIIILTFGVCLFFLTFFACVGALRENICMLQFFSIVLAISFFLQFVAGFITAVLSEQVENIVRNYFTLMIEQYREDPDRQNIIDWTQEEFKCCGTDGYRDWTKNIYFACNASNPSYERCSVPWSCCRFNETSNPEEVVNTTGCIPTMVDWVYHHIFMLACLAVGLAIPQIVGVCISRILLLQIKDQSFFYDKRRQSLPEAVNLRESDV